MTSITLIGAENRSRRVWTLEIELKYESQAEINREAAREATKSSKSSQAEWLLAPLSDMWQQQGEPRHIATSGIEIWSHGFSGRSSLRFSSLSDFFSFLYLQAYWEWWGAWLKAERLYWGEKRAPESCGEQEFWLSPEFSHPCSFYSLHNFIMVIFNRFSILSSEVGWDLGGGRLVLKYNFFIYLDIGEN